MKCWLHYSSRLQDRCCFLQSSTYVIDCLCALFFNEEKKNQDLRSYVSSRDRNKETNVCFALQCENTASVNWYMLASTCLTCSQSIR